MVVFGYFARAIAVITAMVASIELFSALCFRLEGSDELEWVKKVDFALGGAFAVAIVLFFLPECMKQPKAAIVVATLAAILWLGVSGFLISSHERQHRVRSNPPH